MDRSAWPTSVIDVPCARILDWVSGRFLPDHCHTDVQRTDAFVSLAADFDGDTSPTNSTGKVGGDIASCFTTIKHEMVLSTWEDVSTI